MTQPYFVSPEELYHKSVILARTILDSGFRPDYIVGIWRGGTPPGIATHGFLRAHGIKADHFPIMTRRYVEGCQDTESDNVLVHQLEYLIERVNSEDKLLLIDDVFDKGITLDRVVKKIHELARKNTPHDIRIGTVFYKPERRKVELIPDFYVEKTDKWLAFPHEFEDYTFAQIAEMWGPDFAQQFKPEMMIKR